MGVIAERTQTNHWRLPALKKYWEDPSETLYMPYY
jgi:hypothetical protein